MVTGPDIIFFWVARMIMAGLEFRGEVPFKTFILQELYVISNVEKCQKSLGNSPDPIELIEKYGQME